MASFVIKLQRLRFFAHHGVFEEEQIIGNEFEVNLSLKTKAPKETITALEQTINYAEVYRLVKDRFAVPTPLLETLAQDLADSIHEAFPQTKSIRIQITKLHPPITGFEGSVSVSYRRVFNKRIA